MPISLLFWLLMVLWLFFGLWSTWPGKFTAPFGGNLLLFVLLFLLGWKTFGFILQG